MRLTISKSEPTISTEMLQQFGLNTLRFAKLRDACYQVQQRTPKTSSFELRHSSDLYFSDCQIESPNNDDILEEGSSRMESLVERRRLDHVTRMLRSQGVNVVTRGAKTTIVKGKKVTNGGRRVVLVNDAFWKFVNA